MTNAEIYRLIMNLIRFGIVEQVNLTLDPPMARVRCGELLTDWLPWSARRAGNARIWWPPTEGEQVIILAAGGELSAGVAIASLNQKSISAPTTAANTQHTAYPDGAVIEYNADTGALKVTGGGQMSGDIQHTGGTFSSNGVVIDSHNHGGVQRGGENTYGPNT
ncbi:phage baseplate assembly protein V [Yersinia alsatica]|uniref:Phage baseplate assembly protein V n=1 Tax=Yersinia alsatica TaxID=2890317 RepID=A0ABY5UJQ0_9GAMM|nr:phage baseplate assembly protein V [Yersinia alsatica]UWM43691.1 phage baseplate assembly protein V [Yersinia alsatica]CNK72298.1 baseplate assembly protein [Yersinia frederiksenii]CNK73687.1 baseplate assembly protein [Yersinia frederiksenii]